MNRSARGRAAQLANGADDDETMQWHSSKRHAVVHEVPNHWIATLFPVTNNFIDHGDGTSSPKSLATLAAEAVCRNLATSTVPLPGPLPPDVVEELTTTLRMTLAYNPTTLEAFQDNEWMHLDLSQVRNSVTDEWIHRFLGGRIKRSIQDTSPTTAYLKHLDLSGSQITDEGLSAMGRMVFLETVVLDQCHYLMGSEDCRAFHVFASPRLQSVSLQDCRRLEDAAVLALSLYGRDSLRALNLSGCRCLTDQSLVACGTMWQLESLQLEACDMITDAGLERLHHLELAELNLGWCTKISDRGMELLLQQHMPLQRLRVARCRMLKQPEWLYLICSTLSDLDLTGCLQLSSSSLGKTLQGLPHLLHLDVSHIPGIIRSGWQGRVPKLQTLVLSYSAVRDSHLTKWSDFRELVELNLDSCSNVSDSSLRHLVSAAPNLQRLVVADCAISDGGMVHIAKFKQLTHLDLFYCQISNRGLRCLSELTNLQVLSIDSRDVTDSGLIYLQNIKQLVQLDLFSGHVTDRGCQYLSHLTSLESLALCGGGIGDIGCEYLSRLIRLQHLNLSENEDITDQGIAHFKSLSQLRSLNISQTSVTSVMPLASLKQLQSLSVYGCRGMADLHSLETKLPKLRCLRYSNTTPEEGMMLVDPDDCKEDYSDDDGDILLDDGDDDEYSNHDAPVGLQRRDL
ncbi:F-box and leucine-rich repeat protein 14 [Fistulifera solaris]|uniref:F-box and leucine-rich repeat protein 14 n=1 Tax=Fistulifera solaris TaxID=1519565 RepID=A0A1Z5KJS8_FISSO|nr:F-box and leucine-rich repeat protein 14 [Fistulifera solaris]|eukprot:GAX26539.1 F-box and leucine-rich repeat protein 14 [Fistulifera solaris]